MRKPIAPRIVVLVIMGLLVCGACVGYLSSTDRLLLGNSPIYRGNGLSTASPLILRVGELRLPLNCSTLPGDRILITDLAGKVIFSGDRPTAEELSTGLLTPGNFVASIVRHGEVFRSIRFTL